MNTLSFSYKGYNAAAVTAPEGNTEGTSPPPENKCFRAARIRIDSRKNFKF